MHIPPKSLLGDWADDSKAVECLYCKAAFHIFRRKHHCRRCGMIFCHKCTNHTRMIPEVDPVRPVRVCEACKSFLVHLSDDAIQYIQSFLPNEDQDRLLRTSKRFQFLVTLPYTRISRLNERFEWYEPQDVVPIRPSQHSCKKMVIAKDRFFKQSRQLEFYSKDMFFSQRQWQQLQLMIDTLFDASHPNFLDLYEVLQTPTDVVLVLEPLRGESIASWVQREGPLSEYQTATVTWKVLKAVQYLHQRMGVIHRTITPYHIFYDEDTENITLIALNTIKRVKQAPLMADSMSFSNMSFTDSFVNPSMVLGSSGSFASPESPGTLETALAAPTKDRVFIHRAVKPPRPPPILIPKPMNPKAATHVQCVMRHAEAVGQRDGEARLRSRSFSCRAPSIGMLVHDDSVLIPVTPYGRIGYTPPEIVSYVFYHHYGRPSICRRNMFKIDTFGVGCIAWFMFFGDSPWPTEHMAAYTMTSALQPHIPNSKRQRLSPDGAEALLSLLQNKPEDRWGTLQALNSPWLVMQLTTGTPAETPTSSIQA
eukprot:PhM_4_TR4110/c0_g1_i1/m.66243